MRKHYVVVIVLSTITVMAVGMPRAFAYGTYSTGVDDQGNCAQCHGAFKGDDYVSNSEGITWTSNLHDAHTGHTDVTSSPGGCGSCHFGSGTNGREVNLQSSQDARDGVNAIACMGCHGRLEDGAANIGAGLRAHHMGADKYLNWPGGIPNGLSCATCHSGDPTPVAENVSPPWYSSVTNTSIMKVMNPCSVDGEEDFSSNGTGIDNDGDQIYDSLDDGCMPVRTRTDNDVTTFVDVTGDMVPDVASFISTDVGKPTVTVYSGASGDVHSTIGFTNNKWQGFAIGTVRDANQDGSADDPAIAMLVENKTNLKIIVETRRVDTGAIVSSKQFLNEKWIALDVVVVDDTNGDGITNDTSIAVLAQRISDGRILVQLRNFSDGALISNVQYFNARWSPAAAAVADRSAMAPVGTLPPLIAVIAENPTNGKRLLQSRVVGSGAFGQNIKFQGSEWKYQDVTVAHDANGDGLNGDPIWQVLATRDSDLAVRVQSRFVSDGAFDKNTTILNSKWEGLRLDASRDIDDNASQEMVISAIRRADAVRVIHIKDYATGDTTINVWP